MISSAESCATILEHFAARKSRATSVLQVGVNNRMALPVHCPTRRCATASRLQNVRSQMSINVVDLDGIANADIDDFDDGNVVVAVNALAAPAAAIPPILSPWIINSSTPITLTRCLATIAASALSDSDDGLNARNIENRTRFIAPKKPRLNSFVVSFHELPP